MSASIPTDYVFAKPAVCGTYPAVGGGSAFDPDAFAPATNRPCGDRVTRGDADVVVSSVHELNDDVPPGATIWLEADAILGAGGRQWTLDAPDVTLASGRGIGGSKGALVLTNNRVSPQFRITGDGCRVTGIRFRGPEPASFGSPGYAASEAISINADDVEVDNCVVRGYTHAGIEVGSRRVAARAHIHHCDLVDNNSLGLGYGVVVFRGHPHIRACYFDNNRHSVAGNGSPSCGWTTTDCIGGPHHRLHAWDMHEDRNSAGDAGLRMVLKRNVLLNTHNWYDRTGPSRYRQETISIRSIPRDAFVVRDNVFRNAKPREPMRDHNNAAFNVFHASTFAEGKVEGAAENVYEWSGGAVPDGMGPTRDPTVTGYGRKSGGGDGDAVFGPPSDSMTNPTRDRGDDDQYDATITGTGRVSQYALTAKTGVEFPRKEESNDRIEGRTAHGQVSTLDDVVRCTGPITALAVTSGDPAMRVEIGGKTYRASDFPDREPSPGAADGGSLSGTLTFGGTSYDVQLDVSGE